MRSGWPEGPWGPQHDNVPCIHRPTWHSSSVEAPLPFQGRGWGRGPSSFPLSFCSLIPQNVGMEDGEHPPLIRDLLRLEAYPHPVHDLMLHETHGAWVILAGEYA